MESTLQFLAKAAGIVLSVTGIVTFVGGLAVFAASRGSSLQSLGALLFGYGVLLLGVYIHPRLRRMVEEGTDALRRIADRFFDV